MPRLAAQYRAIRGTTMKYVVALITTYSSTNHRGETKYSTSTCHVPAINKADANEIADGFNSMYDGRNYRDGVDLITRTAEVCGVVYSSGIDRSRKIVLSLSDMEMIASEVTAPQAAIAEAAE